MEDTFALLLAAAALKNGSSGDVTAAGDNKFTGKNTFNSDVNLKGKVYDKNGSVGTAGQVLTTTANGVEWLSNGNLSKIHLIFDGEDITFGGEPLTFTQVKTLVENTSYEVFLTNGNYSFRPEYTDGGAIRFMASTSLNNIPYIYRIIINSENAILTDEYPLAQTTDITASALSEKFEGDEFITVDLNETDSKVQTSLDTDYRPYIVELSGTSGVLSDDNYMKLCGETSSYTAQILLNEDFYVSATESEDYDTYVHTGTMSNVTMVKTITIHKIDEMKGEWELTTENIQSKLTFDTAPTADSTNPVTSGGVKTYVDGKQSANNTFTGANTFTGTTTFTQGKVVGLGSYKISSATVTEDSISLTLENM